MKSFNAQPPHPRTNTEMTALLSPPRKLPRLLLADSPLNSSPISSPVPLQPLLPRESTHTPNPATGTEWAVRSDGAVLEVELDVYTQSLPCLSPETISTPQSSMDVLMLAFAYIS